MQIGRRPPEQRSSDPVRRMKLRHLIETHAFIVPAVEIFDPAMLHLGGGFDKGMGQRARLLLIRHLKRPVAAMHIVGAALVVLRPAGNRAARFASPNRHSHWPPSRHNHWHDRVYIAWR